VTPEKSEEVGDCQGFTSVVQVPQNSKSFLESLYSTNVKNPKLPGDKRR
jgi:hypothetical protein